MKKLFLIMLALVVTLSFAGCGEETTAPVGSSGLDNSGETSKPSETVALVDVTTEQNVKIKLPSSLIKQEDGISYADANTSDVAMFIADRADESYPLSEMSQEDFIDFSVGERENLVIDSYDNNTSINGNSALVCKFSFTSPEGNEISAAVVIVLYKGAEYTHSFMYIKSNTDSALAKSLQDCIDSITINY